MRRIASSCALDVCPKFRPFRMNRCWPGRSLYSPEVTPCRMVSNNTKILPNTKLSSYLTSYIPDKWQNKTVSKEWINQLATNCHLKDKSFRFSAENIDQFIDKLRTHIPYLDETSLGTIYSNVTKSVVPLAAPHSLPQEQGYVENVSSCYFASPPLLSTKLATEYCVSYDFHMHKQDIYHINGKFVMRFAYASDINSSLFGLQAMNYAKQYWSAIISDSSEISIKERVNFCDPNQQSKELFGGAKYLFNLHQLRGSSGRSRLVNRSDPNNPIKIITHIPILADELLGGGSWDGSPVSVRTGGSLMKNHCPVTGVKFPDEMMYTYGGDPIDQKMYDYLKSHKDEIKKYFNLDPTFDVVPSKELYEKAFMVYNEERAQLKLTMKKFNL